MMATRREQPEDLVHDLFKLGWDPDSIVAYVEQNLGPAAGERVRKYLAGR